MDYSTTPAISFFDEVQQPSVFDTFIASSPNLFFPPPDQTPTENGFFERKSEDFSKSRDQSLQTNKPEDDLPSLFTSTDSSIFDVLSHPKSDPFHPVHTELAYAQPSENGPPFTEPRHSIGYYAQSEQEAVIQAFSLRQRETSLHANSHLPEMQPLQPRSYVHLPIAHSPVSASYASGQQMDLNPLRSPAAIPASMDSGSVMVPSAYQSPISMPCGLDLNSHVDINARRPLSQSFPHLSTTPTSPSLGSHQRSHSLHTKEPLAWTDIHRSSSTPEMSGVMPTQLPVPLSLREHVLFPGAHPVASFGFGGKLFLSLPRRRRLLNAYSGQQEAAHQYMVGPIAVLSMRTLLEKFQPSIASLAEFPGPLKSKEAVLKFISSKMQGSYSVGEDNDAEGYQLLWGLLKVMCMHYGDLTRAESVSAVRQLLVEQLSAPAPNISIARHCPEGSKIASLVELERLLIAGEREKAWQVAITGGLWDHALFLASQLSPSVYQTTLKQFALSSLDEGSPLRTLYLLSARQPAELFRPNQGGGISPLLDRWRENLAAIISNRQSGDNKVIGQLGDFLWSMHMRVAAAHFCYILAEHPFGTLDNPNSRLILIGADHKTQTRHYITPQSIQRTEIFEFTKRLGNSQFVLPTLQVYKFIYAWMLVEVGLVEPAMRYYEHIHATVKDNTSAYHPFFLYQLETFGERLSKVVLPSTSKGGSIMAYPPSWLTGLLQHGLNALIGEDEGRPLPSPSVASGHGGSNSALVGGLNSSDSRNIGLGTNMGIGPASPISSFTPVTSVAPIPTLYSEEIRSETLTPPSSVQTFVTPLLSPAQLLKPGSTPSEAAPNITRTSGTVACAVTPAASSPSEPASDASRTTSKSSGFWEKISSLTGKLITKKQPSEMILGDEQNFVYNEELGIWHEKGKVPEKESLDLPPPPVSGNAGSTLSSASTPSASSGDMNVASPLTPDVNYSRAAVPSRGRRYLDTFNPDQVFQQSSTPNTGSPLPAVGGNGPTAQSYTVFNPHSLSEDGADHNRRHVS